MTETQAKHTPEPWHTEGESPYHIAIVYHQPGKKFKVVARTPDGTTKENKANARRIVACVNACAGIDTETMERFASQPGLLGAAIAVAVAKALAKLEGR